MSVSAAGAAEYAFSAGNSEVLEGVLEVPGPFALFHGASLPGVRIAWRLAGPRGAPVVTALGGISASRVVCSGPDCSGWWDELVGPGRAVDSRRFQVLGFDFLGGSGATTGPGSRAAFPSVSTFDQAESLRLLLDHLRIEALHAIAGASYGGMIALAFAQRYPRRVRQLLVISAAHRAHPMATAWRSVQREIVRRALARGEGAPGLELARALAMATYRSGEEFGERFSSDAIRRPDGSFTFPVAEYLFARGAAYAQRYSPQAFLCLSESIDLHSVDATLLSTPAALVSIRQDQLVPRADIRELAARMGGIARLAEIDSLYGHDAFLKEGAQLAPVVAFALDDSNPETSRDRPQA